MTAAGEPGERWNRNPRSDRWLSADFVELLADTSKWRERPDADTAAFDVIVVGSGYGGAVAAAGLSGCDEVTADGARRRIDVCVLERGREYLPGAFPSRMSELPRQLRGSFAGRRAGGEGLFDLRIGGDASVVVASGLGGGSLINAGVMETPDDAVLDRFWPAQTPGLAPRAHYFREARRLLGASRPDPNDPSRDRDTTIRDHAAHAARPLDKFKVLEQMAPPGAFRPAAVTVAMRDGHTTSAGVRLAACTLCGDCATGCNQGAKESLDTNLLVQAHRRGAAIYCGATVLRLQRSTRHPQLWCLLVAHTDPQLRAREGAPRWIAARRVALAAGTLGSTEILLRSQCADAGPALSPQLGRRFSGNGDLLLFGYDYRGADGAGTANAMADENRRPGERRVGPTITGVIDPRQADARVRPPRPLLIEEMAVPGALRRFAEEMVTTAAVLHGLQQRDASPHAHGHPVDDPCAVDPQRMLRTSVFAAMGDDDAAGELRLATAAAADCDGQIDVVWPELRKHPLFDVQTQYLRERAAGFGGLTIANPMWRLVPDAVEAMTGIARGPQLTVHPLGGCAIGADAEHGVVDLYGRVHDAGSAGAVHDGLVVLDGAIVPCALGANPALTIAALALQAIDRLRADWRLEAPAASSPAPLERPLLRTRAEIDADIDTQAKRPVAQASISERLAGEVTLRDAGGTPRACWVELTLSYAPFAPSALFRPDAEGRLRDAVLTLPPSTDAAQPGGRLRIFLLDEWRRIRDLPEDETRRRLEDAAARSWALDGTLTVFEREASGAVWRSLRALSAWARNRGLRDACEAWRRDGLRILFSGGRLLGDAWRLASQAGAVRLFRYALTIGRALPDAPPPAEGAPPRFEPPARFSGLPLEGRKRITYARPSNPWRQLQELSLSRVGDALLSRRPAVLTLDQQYLAARAQALLRLESQRDHFEALVDLGGLALTLLRALLPIHLWNTRKPDAPTARAPVRLPGRLPGLPDPEIHAVEVDHRDGRNVQARLTRYRAAKPRTDLPPVLMIHGYSAGGTTFAHPALKPGLARALALAGRDVWVADLRSSCGMPEATQPWTFERIALADIPALADRICRVSGHAQLDVVAHCMGAAMLSMAVLSADLPAQVVLSARDEDFVDRFRAARRALPRRIRRAVLSQVGPAVVLSQSNIFRAFVMSFAEQFLGPLSYRFRPEPEQGAVLDLLDRLLASVPYDDAELRIENPWQPWRRTRYTGTRHRMDALYGCTFKLANVDAAVLDHIDDFFGPMSMDTLAQVIHLARLRTVANRIGRNRFVSPQRLAALWTFPTMSIHGEDNGLADIATLEHMEQLMRKAGCDFTPVPVPGYGHQDCLIGTGLDALFGRIRDFLGEAQRRPVPVALPPPALHAQAPWLGPMLLPRPATSDYALGLGADPALGMPVALALAAVERSTASWRRRRALPVQHRLLQQTPDSDWLAEPLPAWAAVHDVSYLAALFVYARDAQAPLAPDPAALDAAVDAALARMDAASAALPPGIVDLSWMQPGAADALRIALGSCQYPAGIFDDAPAHASWQRLVVRCADAQQRPQALILTGDQVYLDATAGLFDPAQRDERCRKPYEHWLQQRHVRDAMRRLPVYTMLDDHELDNDWEPLPESADAQARARNARHLQLGVDAFRHYQRGGGSAPLWFEARLRDAELFVADTRSERECRNAANAATAALMQPAQHAALLDWIDRGARHDRPKLLVSPAAILPRHRYALPMRAGTAVATLQSDGWDGWPASWQAVLARIADSGIRTLVLLSGDEHLGLWVSARLQRMRDGVVDRDVRFESVHTAGLYTPYRFANAKPAELLLDDEFEFAAANGRLRYRCTLHTRVFEGAGFTYVTLARAAAARWRLHVEYDDGSGAPQRGGEVELG